MSEYIDRIDRALTTEWKSTRELAREAGDHSVHISANIGRHLRSLERYGLAESRGSVRAYPSGTRRVTEWRRPS